MHSFGVSMLGVENLMSTWLHHFCPKRLSVRKVGSARAATTCGLATRVSPWLPLNGGSPKWMVYTVKSKKKWWFRGTPGTPISRTPSCPQWILMGKKSSKSRANPPAPAITEPPTVSLGDTSPKPVSALAFSLALSPSWWARLELWEPVHGATSMPFTPSFFSHGRPPPHLEI